MQEAPNTIKARGCPACASPDAQPAGEKNEYQLLCCLNCRTLYSAILPPSLSYDDYYGSRNLQVPSAIVKRIEQIVAGFAPYRSSSRFLDVGFGAGSYLSAATKAGWDATGVEVSTPALDHARNAGLNVFCGELGQAAYPDAYFDVVTAVEVLEHLPEPLELLREIVRVLRPGGLFFATTPHVRGLSYHLLHLEWSTISPPEHLQIFSRSGMRALLKTAGFQHVGLRTHGFNPTEVYYTLRRRAVAYRRVASRKFEDPRPDGAEFDRVAAAYALNTALMQGRTTRALKTITNGALNMLRQGDTLNIEARH